MITNVPNFVLSFIFTPLGTKLQQLTGEDIIAIDLNEKVKTINLPAFFMVAATDNISG